MQTPKGKITIGELSQECVDDLASLGDIKIDKTQIKNNLTETETGNVLDAVQGRVLNEQISNLSELAFKKPTPIPPSTISVNDESMRQNGNYSSVFLVSPFSGTCFLSVHEVSATFVLQQIWGSVGGAWRIVAKTGDVSGTAWTRFAMTKHLITQQDPDTVVISGEHTTNVGTLPYADYFHIVSQIESDSNYGFQIACARYSTRLFFRHKATTWRPWIQVAITDKIDISLLNGWTSIVSYSHFGELRRSGNIVSFGGVITGGTIAQNTTIMQLPVGWRPFKNTSFSAVVQDASNNLTNSLFTVLTGGECRIPLAIPSNHRLYVSGSFSLD